MCLPVVIPLFLNAQENIERIRNNSSYWSAEGTGVTVTKAEEDAMARIARSIQSFISTGSKDTGDNFEAFVESFSCASLQNIGQTVLDDEPDARVFCWVSRADVDTMFRARAKRVKDFIKAGKKAESDLQIDDALRNYHWAYMLSKVCREQVYCEFDGNTQDCLIFLPSKIKSVLAGINAKFVDCTQDFGRYQAHLQFTYGGHDVASLELRYYDGVSYQSIKVKDGIGELELSSLPTDGKLKLSYEYRFAKEASNLDRELEAIFTHATSLKVDASAAVPVSVNVKKGTITTDKKHTDGYSIALPAETQMISAEKVDVSKRMELDQASSTEDLLQSLRMVENAIRQKAPQSVKTLFTDDGYYLWMKMFSESAEISLVGKQTYEFIDATKEQGQILGRFCKVKVKHKTGKAFMENITFRFDPASRKIKSVAYALTKKAEDDIFNSASSWPTVSRFAILQFMEDYQTAYALKRLDYIDKIYSEDALILAGTVIKTPGEMRLEGQIVKWDYNDTKITRYTKKEFINRLTHQFRDREYVHLTFEDNVTTTVNAPRFKKGTIFAIQINQYYESPAYCDKGYLTLMFDASKELPIIHVRYWQPDREDIIKMSDFINNFEW